MKKIILFGVLGLFLLLLYGGFGQEKTIKEDAIKMNLVGKTLLGKVGAICYETDSPNFAVGTEIFLKVKVGQEYITLTEKEVETTNKNGSDYIKNTYGKEQKFAYKIKDNKIVVDCKNTASKLLFLELKNEKIIGDIKEGQGKGKEVVFWEDLTSICNKELVTRIATFECENGDLGSVFMRVKIVGDTLFFSTGTKTPPCGTIAYSLYKQYSYTQQEHYLQVHFTAEQKEDKEEKLLLLYVKEGKLFGNIKISDGNIKEVEFVIK